MAEKSTVRIQRLLDERGPLTADDLVILDGGKIGKSGVQQVIYRLMDAGTTKRVKTGLFDSTRNSSNGNGNGAKPIGRPPKKNTDGTPKHDEATRQKWRQASKKRRVALKANGSSPVGSVTVADNGTADIRKLMATDDALANALNAFFGPSPKDLNWQDVVRIIRVLEVAK